MSARNRLATVAFYGGLIALIVAIGSGGLRAALPGGLAKAIADNSEAYVAALLISAWIQFVRGRLAGRPQERAVSLAAAVACFLAGLLLLQLEVPGWLGTLNEALTATAAVILWVQPARPVDRRLVVAVVAGLVVFIALANRSAFVTDWAEALALVAIVPVGFDLVDRRILDPSAADRLPVRIGWYATLCAVPLLVHFMEPRAGSGLAGDALGWMSRVNEAWVAMLLIELYFTVVLDRSWRERERSSAAPTLH